ncbi:hypothetical protein M011DRAFT_529339 [Sporormia fimetaria CBS 119925]|uniref:H-type lectin domain-containing protein n=1 Tax=Sporormia fimetaria CBS 119925 TaxID=1340428 RepID=A0A6A6V188_9PLEO|nr:hypothetical protein M011DRAFT_529339 [Sporormia fimetaria CBS 119925]
MSLLLAPYTHAMRLGQGFNSYTQTICIDGAVVVDEATPENVVTNDGTTMRIMAQKNGTPSAWTRQKEVITGQAATAVLVENAKKAKEAVAIIEQELAVEDELETEPGALGPEAAPEAEVELEESNEPPPEPESAVEPTVEEERIEESPQNEAPQQVAEEAVEESEVQPELREKHSAEESVSIDEVADAEEARAEAEAPVAEEGEVKQPESTPTSAAFAAKTRGRSSPTAAKTSTRPIVPAKGDSDDMEREAIIANLQANAPEGPKLGVKATVAGLRRNTKEVPSKTALRSASSDRARLSPAAGSSGTVDRAAIRAALTGNAVEDPAKRAKQEAELARQLEEEAQLLREQRALQREIEKQNRLDEAERRKEACEEQRAIRQEQREWDRKRREEARKAIESAADLKAATLKDLEKIRAQNQFVERFNGMSEQSQKYDFDPTAPRGPSQTVTYSSRFVDRLSDVLDDMSVSGSLSIKAGKIGGSGKGSFVDSDKFKESDLNFFISVKVVNQTINFKDALVFNPLRSVTKDNFRDIYGDSFISGFIEGGEFNALVSMKILNKAKKTDIQAEAKVALTAGPVNLTAEANVGIARSNIETNTETTIQVSWSGGGHIKPMEQQWDIQSLMAAAARFPDLVADCPQRTYAILTKYDALRSFQATKPAAFTPLQYENAQIYTNTLLDSFVSYKAMYKRLGEQIFGIQGKTLEIVPWPESDKDSVMTSTSPAAVMSAGTKDPNTGFYPYQESPLKFEASLKGLSDARTAVRRQMARIVNEVDLIEKDPKLATDEDHHEPYQSPVAFEARIPVVQVPERLRIKSTPLSGRRIAAKELSEEDQEKMLRDEEELAADAPLFKESEGLSQEEELAFNTALKDTPTLGQHFRASRAVGDSLAGESFNNIDFLKPDWNVTWIRTEMGKGALVYLAIRYSNGIVVEKGAFRDQSRLKTFGPFLLGERINSASIEHGVEHKESVKEGETKEKKITETSHTQILGLRLFTNRGRALVARASKSEIIDKGIVIRDGVTYKDVNVTYIDAPFHSGSIKGFFGRSNDGTDGTEGKIFRLGLIWCKMPEVKADEAESQFAAADDTVDSQDLAALRGDQSANSNALREAQQKLQMTLKALEDKQKRLEAVERLAANVNTDIQFGNFLASEKGWARGENSFHRISVPFERRYVQPPKLLFGLSMIDAFTPKQRALSLGYPDVTTNGFSIQAASFDGCNGFEIGCNWLTLPEDIHLETGMLNTYSGGKYAYGTYLQEVTFSQSFEAPPKVCVWFQEINYGHQDFISMKCEAVEVTANRFIMKVESWANRTFRNARVQYLAYPAAQDGKRIKSARELVTRQQKFLDKRGFFYGEPFRNTPASFIAISEIDLNSNANSRFRGSASAPNNKELTWSYGTWADTDMDHGAITWIAIE